MLSATRSPAVRAGFLVSGSGSKAVECKLPHAGSIGPARLSGQVAPSVFLACTLIVVK